ncbi:alpha/beta hydrolase [Cupriavidus pauculus]|uniref:RBBP9/YdeN family alpha/beta hydrolase n=1 Tax=Cupriavidus pauculus TaxID=82633 RepID=UPI001EE2AD6E|nr:alpha/beta hydrolase [Cupriavidus pauculus]GJG94209.1 alpha/beta hydrolase [Cupriavidus pauculus]
MSLSPALSPDTTVLLVPGLREYVPDHWQTLLQADLHAMRQPVASVSPLEHDKLSCGARIAALDRALAAIDGPVLLAAHSAGVMITGHWARQLHRHLAPGKIVGALLATPADLESPMPTGYPEIDTLAHHGWLPVPRTPLPFPTLLAASRNDPLASYERAAGMARDWGSAIVDLGHVGHLNPAAGFGPWPDAMPLLARLAR